MSEQNLSVLFNTLEQAKKTKTVGSFQISELTLAQQRELLVTVFDPIQTPAKLSIAFNKIINDCVVSPNEEISVLTRPFLLRELRDLSIGDTFTRMVTNDEGEEEVANFKFKKNNFKAISNLKTTAEIKINEGITLHLKIPSLAIDTKFNKDLLQHIAAYRRRTENKVDNGLITSMYMEFELLKYIDQVTINEEIYKISTLTTSEQIRLINSLAQEHIASITNFVEIVKDIEKFAFSATNLKTNKEEVVSIDYSIFSKEISH